MPPHPPRGACHRSAPPLGQASFRFDDALALLVGGQSSDGGGGSRGNAAWPTKEFPAAVREGDEVECRDEGDEAWRRGVVTEVGGLDYACLGPRVLCQDYSEPFHWDHVRFPGAAPAAEETPRRAGESADDEPASSYHS